MSDIIFPYKSCYKIMIWLKANPKELTTIKNISEKSKFNQRSIATTIQVLIDNKLIKVTNKDMWQEMFNILK